MMKIILKICGAFLIGLILISCKNNSLNISYDDSLAILNYGVSILEKQVDQGKQNLIKNDLNKDRKGIVLLTAKDTLNSTYHKVLEEHIGHVENDGFIIAKRDKNVFVIGKTANGCLYGLFDVMEQMGATCNMALVADKQVNPAIPFRAVKINLPWSPYRPGPTNDVHIETCKDLKFWESFLDMLAKNRFNAVSLWNNHPFPYMIRAKNYPKATAFSDEELAEWQEFYKSLFRMAKERGLETYLVNWNIVVSPSFAENYGAKEYFDRSELVKKYTRESVTQLINEYEDLTGFGTTLADWMGNWGDEKMTPKEREDWIQETIVEGIKNANREIKFIHRAVLSGDPALMREVIDYADLPDKTIVEIKFNWSHGHSTPKLSLTHANDDGTIMKGFWEPKPENFYIAWMVRNEDFFVLRWGNPEFIRDHIRTNKYDYVQGYFIGSEGYIPAKDYAHIESHPHKTWKYGFQKQWMFYHLWGRLLYYPNERDEVLVSEISKRYPDVDALSFLKAYALSSEVPLNIASFYKGTWDFTLYSEGFLSAWQGDNGEGRSPFISLEELISQETLDKSYLNIEDYCYQLYRDSLDTTKMTPLQMAEKTRNSCNQSLKILQNLENQSDDLTFQSEIADLKTWAYLGNYFAEKIDAGVAFKTYTLTKDAVQKDSSLIHARKALEFWKKVVELTEDRYQEMPYVIMSHPENRWADFQGFHWKNYLSEAEYDIEYIQNSD